MKILLNGEEQTVGERTTVADVLTSLELLSEPGVGVECNNAFVEPTDYVSHVLVDGDRVEIIRFLGGG